MKERADKLLCSLKFFESRKRAQIAIQQGFVTYINKRGVITPVKKISDLIDLSEVESWQIQSPPELEFVSRAGYKLAGALKEFQFSPKGMIALDIGLSTGGFTQCLLKHGAKKVFGADVGSEQLHASLRDDPRLTWYDKLNCKEPLPREKLELFFSTGDRHKFDLFVIDVSFISLIKVLEPQLQYLSAGGHVISLVKPQFEVGREKIGKKGLVAKEDGLLVLQKTVNTINSLGLKVITTAPAIIEGEDGNQEYFIYSIYS